MSQKIHRPMAAAGLVLVGIYSAVMVATSGSAEFAWIILVGAVALVVGSVRRVATGQDEGRGG